MTVEPVVVMPLIDSKNASVKPSENSRKTKGSAPKSAANDQHAVVITKACRRFNGVRSLWVVITIVPPANTVTAPANKNARQSGVPL